MKQFLSYALMLSAVLLSSPAAAQMENPKVGGEAMLVSQDIVTNAAKSADHTTLVAAVQAAGLVETLKGSGPFTVFAPTDAAFSMLPSGTVESLMRSENKETLAKVLTYHVVPGRLDTEALMDRIRAANGPVSLTTVAGGTLEVSLNGPRNLMLKDAKGNTANIAVYDVYQSNGVIYVIDRVLMPN